MRKVQIAAACLAMGSLTLSSVPFSEAAAQTSSAPSGYGRTISGKTHVERAIGKCVGAVLIGGLLGAGIGAAAGNTKKGALIGLGVGVGACAILLKLASNRDREMLRGAQLKALNQGGYQRAVWTNDEGAQVNAEVTAAAPGEVLMSQAGSIECRSDDQCRIGDSWYPKADIIAGRSAANAPKLVKASFTDAHPLLCRRSTVKISVENAGQSDGQDISCLVGDTWVTGDQLKKIKIQESHIRA